LGFFFLPLSFFPPHSAEIPGDDLFSLRTCHSYFLRFSCVMRSRRRLVFYLLFFSSVSLPILFSLLSSLFGKWMAQDARVKRGGFLVVFSFPGGLVSFEFITKGVGWLVGGRRGRCIGGDGCVQSRDIKVGKRRENRLIECPTSMFAYRAC